jgi:hypothetical protein
MKPDESAAAVARLKKAYQNGQAGTRHGNQGRREQYHRRRRPRPSFGSTPGGDCTDSDCGAAHAAHSAGYAGGADGSESDTVKATGCE